MRFMRRFEEWCKLDWLEWLLEPNPGRHVYTAAEAAEEDTYYEEKRKRFAQRLSEIPPFPVPVAVAAIFQPWTAALTLAIMILWLLPRDKTCSNGSIT